MSSVIMGHPLFVLATESSSGRHLFGQGRPPPGADHSTRLPGGDNSPRGGTLFYARPTRQWPEVHGLVDERPNPPLRTMYCTATDGNTLCLLILLMQQNKSVYMSYTSKSSHSARSLVSCLRTPRFSKSFCLQVNKKSHYFS